MSDLDLQKIDYYKENDIAVESQKILEPYFYLNQFSKKAKEYGVVNALKICYDAPEDKLELCCKIAETFYFVTLLLDDIEDSSDVRLRLPSAHLVYGIRSVYNAARHVISLLITQLQDFCGPQVYQTVFVHSVASLRGTAKEILWRDRSTCPTVEQYKQMASEKSCLVKFIADLLITCSANKLDLTDFAMDFTLFYQIRNDYLSLCCEENAAEKCFCEDIAEGKFSFPIIHAIQTRPDDHRIINILKQKPKDVETRRFCLSLLKEFGSLDYTQHLIEEMKDGLIGQLEKFPQSKTLIYLFEAGLGIK